MTTDDLTFFGAEPLLIEALRAGVPGFVSVKAGTELPSTIEALGKTPAAFVIADGTSDHASINGVVSCLTVEWSIAVLVRSGETQANQATQRNLADELASEAFATLEGMSLPYSKPLMLTSGPDFKYYPGGQTLCFMTFAQRLVRLPRKKRKA